MVRGTAFLKNQVNQAVAQHMREHQRTLEEYQSLLGVFVEHTQGIDGAARRSASIELNASL